MNDCNVKDILPEAVGCMPAEDLAKSSSSCCDRRRKASQSLGRCTYPSLRVNNQDQTNDDTDDYQIIVDYQHQNLLLAVQTYRNRIALNSF